MILKPPAEDLCWRSLVRPKPTLAYERVSDGNARVKRVLTQKPKDKNKLYSLHAPEVECSASPRAKHVSRTSLASR